MSFQDIIGHELIKKQIQNSIEQDKFSHAHLIVGKDGIGKSLIAKEIALRLLGKQKNMDYVDIIEWRIKENKKSIGVNEIRDIIKEVNKKPYEGNKKIIIVYKAHKMTTEAQNAFLKTIEEPPKGVTIMLLSESLDDILETIRSRCQIHKLKRLNSSEIRKYVSLKHPSESEEKINLSVVFSEGIPGRCDMFLKDKSFEEMRNISLNILSEILKKEKNIIKKYEKFFYDYKDKWEEILNCLLLYIRDIVMYKEIGNKDLIINFDKFDNIKYLSNMYSFNKLYSIIEVVNKARENAQRKVNLVLSFDMMLLKMQEV